MPRFEKAPSEYIEKVVHLNRVSKTVKGGRVMKFSALMVVGDGKGKVGFGLGKAAEVPEAIRKGLEDAKKNMMTVTMSGSTIRPCRHGGGRHPGHPRQVPALQQPPERGLRHLRGPEEPARPRGCGPRPRQERGRDHWLRRG